MVRPSGASFVSVSLLIAGPAVVRLPSGKYSVSVSIPLARFPSVVPRFLVRFQNRSLINATQVGPERISDRREIEIALAERAEQLWCENGRGRAAANEHCLNCDG